MRQFDTVSISPWANPYASGGTNTGKNFYATAPAPKAQPAFRRIVPLPQVFSYTSVAQVVAEESKDDNQAGMLDTFYA
jgi:hypothetical protein